MLGMTYKFYFIKCIFFQFFSLTGGKNYSAFSKVKDWYDDKEDWAKGA